MDEAIRALVESVENIAPHVWAVAVRQAQIDAWLSLFWFMVCVGIVVAYVHALRVGLRQFKESGEDEFILWDGSVLFILATVFIGVCMVVAIPLSLTSAVKGLANPEYAAMKALLALVS